MPQINCPLCDNNFSSDRLESHIDDSIEYSLYECHRCATQFWLPLKNPGAEWYSNDSRYFHRTFNPNWSITKYYRVILDYFKARVGKIFDVGCSTGHFLNYARERGWDVYGVDFESRAVTSARDFFDLPNLEAGSIYDYFNLYPERVFDLITFFNVFEHLDDHHKFLTAVNEHLAPDGCLALNIPYRLSARWLQPNDLPPRHLTRWDEKSISNILELNGFKVVFLKKERASFHFVLLKVKNLLKFNLSLGIIGKTETKLSAKPEGLKFKENKRKIKYLRYLAKMKDYLILGLPTVFVWLFLLLSNKLYIDLYVIATKK